RATWQRVIDTNLTGAFLCTKHAARHMRRQGAGKIINIASIYGVVAPSKGLQVAYTVAKHGMIGLTRVNAVELAPLGIQVNAVVPGWYFYRDDRRAARHRLRAIRNQTDPSRPLGRGARPRRYLSLPGLGRVGLRDGCRDPGRRRLYRKRRPGAGLTAALRCRPQP